MLNEAEDNITKTELNKRIKELDEKRVSEDANLLEELFALFTEDANKAEEFVLTEELFKEYDLRNKNGKLGKAKVQNAIRRQKDRLKFLRNIRMNMQH